MSQPPSSSSSQNTVSFRERLGSLVTNSYHLTASQVQAIVDQAVSGVRNFVQRRNTTSTRDRDHRRVSERDASPLNDNVTDVGNVIELNQPGPSHIVTGESYPCANVPPPQRNFYSSSDDEESYARVPESRQVGGGLKRKSLSKRGKNKKIKSVQNDQTSKAGKCTVKTKHVETCTEPSQSLSGETDTTPNDFTLNDEFSEDDIFEDIPVNQPSTATWTFVDQRVSKRFGVREVWYDFQSELHGATSIRETLEYLQNALQELRTLLLNGTEERDYVRLVLVSDQLNVPIAFPWVMVRDFDISHILERIEQVLNSNQEFFLNPGFTIRFHHVANPAGGRARKFDGVPAALAAAKKKSIITVPSDDADELCFARAVLIATRHAQNDPIFKSWSRNGRRACKTLRDNAKKLFADAGVKEGPVDSSQFEKFQNILTPQYRLHIYRGRKKESLVYMGPPAEKSIYLYQHGGHFDVISNPAAFLCAMFVCEKCHETYRDKRYHECFNMCPDCQSSDCDSDAYRHNRATPEPVICLKCNMTFLTQACYRLHLVTLFDNQTACQRRYKCPKCEKVFDKDVVGGDIQNHKCSDTFCKTCRKTVDGRTHKCFMKVTRDSPYHPCNSNPKPAQSEPAQKQGSSKTPPRNKKLAKKYIFFDFECMQDTGIHIPNFVHATWECSDCMDSGNTVQHCERCGPCDNRHVTFEGPNTVIEFSKWLFSPENHESIAIAHNAKAYDSYFLLNHLVSIGITPQVILNGGKIISLKTLDPKIEVKDSLNFFQMSLSKLPKTFGLKELKKGYFPHFFNKPENTNYIGPLPDKKWYGPDAMMKPALEEFEAWHDKLSGEGYVFDMRQELRDYCRSDVHILYESCKMFRANFKQISATPTNPKGIDPFLCSLTLPSACNLLFRTNYLKPYTIALIPQDGYLNSKHQSIRAGEWLHWESLVSGMDIQHAYNGGERKVHGRFVDGYCEKDGVKRVWEFMGCFYHGCPDCFDPEEVNPKLKKKMGVLFNESMHRVHMLKVAGYTVHVIWGHEWNLTRKEPEVYERIKHLENTYRHPLNPRDSFYGGRTDGCALFYEVKPGEKIRYLDFTSLYPYINKFGRYPIGHPKIILSDFPPLKNILGLIKCRITPPKNLFHPVLPYRSGGKLTFPLCSSCANSLNQGPCHHLDAQRELEGVWVSEELKKAVEMGYTNVRMTEVWHFEQSTQYDKRTQSGGLFASYINAFMRIKQESSGFPTYVQTETDRQAYVNAYLDHEGIQLDSSKIEKNPGMRAIAKSVCNVIWGKFAERENLKQSKFVKTVGELLDMFRDSAINVKDLIVHNEDVIEVHYDNNAGFVEQNVNTNIIVASFTTALARLKLYSVLEQLDDRVLYHDTDSAVFRTDPTVEHLDPKTGNFLGDLTDEIDDTGEEFIETWVCGGPKNYSYRTNKGHVVCKVRGFTLNVQNSLVINHDTLKELVHGEVGETRTVRESKITRDIKTRTIHTAETKKDYRVVFTKRVRLEGGKTLPYGHENIPVL